MGILSVILSVVFLLTCVLVILIVLLQPSHGEGLGSAFGGGISESFFGTHAMTWLARATIVLALFFLGLAILLNKLPRTATSDSVMAPAGAPAFPVMPTDDKAPAPTPAPPPSSTPASSSAPSSPATPAPSTAPAPEAPAPAPTPAPEPSPVPKSP